MTTILCGDDDEHVRRIIGELLTRRGYTVKMAVDGQEVLEAVDAEPPDLILLDLNMPRLDGLQVLRGLRDRPAAFGIPVIVISGLDDEETMIAALSNGAADFIAKPFTIAEIMAKVTMALKRRQERQSADPELALSDIFAGRYRLLRRLTGGGFSQVYLAECETDPSLGQVALKVFDLPQTKRADKRFISLFLREAYELSKLSHPCIVAFYEFGQAHRYYFLAMEYLEGKSLHRLVSEGGPLLVGDVIHVGREVARAMSYLADQHMVHRDIKPPNIVVTRSGQVKLLDFGLAKQEDDAHLTAAHEFRGTPSFVSPEHLVGDHPITVKSDIYSLGVTLYYAATGVILFAGRTPMDILHSHRTVVPPSLTALDSTIDPAFADLITRMLAKHPADRPEIEEVVDRLNRLRQPAGSLEEWPTVKLRQPTNLPPPAHN